MLLKIVRMGTYGKTVMGELWVVDHLMGDNKLCDTIENLDYLIPELIYPVHVSHSPKFRRLLPIINNVPGRSGIRMHVGNEARDSQGCVLLGNANGKRLLNSRVVEKMVTKLLLSIDVSREEIRLEVTHYEPPYPGYPYTDYSHYYASPSARTYISSAD